MHVRRRKRLSSLLARAYTGWLFFAATEERCWCVAEAIFTEFRQVLFHGSIADDGSLDLHTIDIGLRMKFGCGEQFVITSPVQSLSRHSADAA
jgi:hypothetical protein